tara:strand:+ start:275 stop:433 length:159 start_codon:yes stop_codon:yes gene_type:complete
LKEKIQNIIKEEYKKRLNEELSIKDLDKIRSLIRNEVAFILFDLYKKRGTWV